MKKALLIFALLIPIFIFYSLDSSFTKEEVIGTYINKNFSNPICCVEAPHTPDTLVLHGDNTLFSGYFGKGTYTLSTGFLITEISISYMSDQIPAGLKTYFTKSLTGTPRIVLNADLDHYYEKQTEKH